MRRFSLHAEMILTDARYAIRTFTRERGFAMTAVLALALGIGSSTAVFSFVDRILFRDLPYPAGDRLVTVGMLAPIEQREFMLGSDYVIWRAQQTPFAAMTSFDASGVTDCDLTAPNPARLHCAYVESSFLPTLGVQPLLGRNFTAEEDRPNGPSAALISYGLWKSRFGGNPNIIGSTFPLDKQPTTIVGVLKPDFEFPTLAQVDVLVPQRLDLAAQQRPKTGAVLRVYARMKPGVAAAQAKAALTPLFHDSLQFVPPQFRHDVKLSVRSVRDLQTHEIKTASWILLAAVAAVLLLACANVANLLLARGTARRREIAIRAVLGAGRARLIRQNLTESIVLGAAGGAAGILVASWLLQNFRRHRSSRHPAPRSSRARRARPFIQRRRLNNLSDVLRPRPRVANPSRRIAHRLAHHSSLARIPPPNSCRRPDRHLANSHHRRRPASAKLPQHRSRPSRHVPQRPARRNDFSRRRHLPRSAQAASLLRSTRNTPPPSSRNRFAGSNRLLPAQRHHARRTIQRSPN